MKAPEGWPLGYVEDAFEGRTPLAGFFNILRCQIRFRNITERGGSVTSSEWDIPWEGTTLD